LEKSPEKFRPLTFWMKCSADFVSGNNWFLKPKNCPKVQFKQAKSTVKNAFFPVQNLVTFI